MLLRAADGVCCVRCGGGGLWSVCVCVCACVWVGGWVGGLVGGRVGSLSRSLARARVRALTLLCVLFLGGAIFVFPC